MVRGFYTAASGLVTNEKKLNTYANNIANVGTAGYKKDNLIAGTFGEHMATRLNNYQGTASDQIGRGVYMQTVESKYIDHTQGGFQQTDRTLDLAVQGEGYFVVEDEEGNEMLTRNGQFALDEDGYLVMPGVGRVQGVDGDLQPGVSNFSIDRAGNVYIWEDEDDDEATLVDRLAMALPEDYESLEKLANGLYTSSGHIIADEGDVMLRQGFLERSNVDMSEEMTRILASQRSLQSCSQIVKMYDEIADQINTRISKI